MLKIKRTGWLSRVGGGGSRQFGEEQTQCPFHVRGGGQWSRGIRTHFINRVESVNFKENHARVYYLYMEHSIAPNVGRFLSCLLFTMSWPDLQGWWCRCQPKKVLVFWVNHKKKKACSNVLEIPHPHMEKNLGQMVCPHYRALASVGAVKLI